MRKELFLIIAVCLSATLFGQNINDIITVKEVKRIESALSSDDMEGRKTFSRGIEKAADFIEKEFSKAGLKPMNDKRFLQEFSITEAKNTFAKVVIDGKAVPDSMVVVSSYQKEVHFTEHDPVEIVKINASDDFRSKIWPCITGSKNLLVLVDASFKMFIPRLNGMNKIQMEQKNNSVIIVFGITEASAFDITLHNELNIKKLANVVGMLPGKSKPEEYVIFSAHYDHLGFGTTINGDSLYNGANDDAAGTTAVIMLADYFRKINSNDRTLIFVAFTAEEIGGYGSQYFSKKLDPAKVTAMFNIEMIGTESKWGKNSAYITGYEKSDMGKILQENLKGSSFTFYPDPYKEQNLFYRSDNATLARLGVPAHTISTSKMDNEPNYHKPSDEINTLDLENMVEIIKAIAISGKSIVNGSTTPSRVDTSQLK